MIAGLALAGAMVSAYAVAALVEYAVPARVLAAPEPVLALAARYVHDAAAVPGAWVLSSPNGIAVCRAGRGSWHLRLGEDELTLADGAAARERISEWLRASGGGR